MVSILLTLLLSVIQGSILSACFNQLFWQQEFHCFCSSAELLTPCNRESDSNFYYWTVDSYQTSLIFLTCPGSDQTNQKPRCPLLCCHLDKLGKTLCVTIIPLPHPVTTNEIKRDVLALWRHFKALWGEVVTFRKPGYTGNNTFTLPWGMCAWVIHFIIQTKLSHFGHPLFIECPWQTNKISNTGPSMVA